MNEIFIRTIIRKEISKIHFSVIFDFCSTREGKEYWNGSLYCHVYVFYFYRDFCIKGSKIDKWLVGKHERDFIEYTNTSSIDAP